MSFFKSFAEKLKNAGNKWTQSVSNLFSDDPVDEGFWDELEEQLILGDVGIETTEELITELRRVMIDKRISNKRELKNAFADLLIARLEAVPGMGRPLDVERKPSVVIMIGVNGSGKTTTCGKLSTAAERRPPAASLPRSSRPRARRSSWPRPTPSAPPR